MSQLTAFIIGMCLLVGSLTAGAFVFIYLANKEKAKEADELKKVEK